MKETTLQKESLLSESADSLLTEIYNSLSYVNETDIVPTNSDYVKIKNASYYFGSVMNLRREDRKISFSIGHSFRFIIIATVNPVSETVDVTTYTYEYDLTDVNLSKELLKPINKLNISDSISTNKNRVACDYLDNIIDYLKSK